MDEGNLKKADDSFCSSVLTSNDSPDWQMQGPVERTSQELPMTEEVLMETTENDDVTELEKSSSNILQMAFLLKTEIERFDYHLSSSSELPQSVAFPEEGSDSVFEDMEQMRKSPSRFREPSELHQFGDRKLDHALRTIKHRSFPIFGGESDFQTDFMMDTVEPFCGVERSVSASAFGHDEELELEMKQAGDGFCRMFQEDQISDSSLTLAANRSLDMSRSLTDRCCKMAELAVSSDDLCSDRFSRRRIWKALSSDAPQYNSPKVTSKNLKPSTIERSLSPFSDRKTLPRTTVDVDHLLNAKSAQRFCVVEEIVETERKYCTCLWILINHFAESLSVSELLTTKDINIVFFSCLRRIYTYHCEFFDKLQNRLVNWSEFSTVADLFSHLFEAVDEHSQCDLFMQYHAYVDVFPVALLRIRKLCQRNTELHKFVKDLESQSCCEGLDIGAYLLTPIQRIPRYVLLLKQLVKCTDNAHPDFILVESCLLRLGEFLSRLNQSIKQSMELVSANTVPRRKRQFNLAGISFRGNNSTNTEGRHRWSFRHQKNSSPPNANRTSLDLSFLGLLRQKKQNGAKDKKALSEQCLRTALPDQKDPLSSDQLLTSTPCRFHSQPPSCVLKSVLPKPFKVLKPKRKLEEEEPGVNVTEDAMNEVFSSPNIPSHEKTGKSAHPNGFRDLSLRVQVNRKAFLSKFRRRANQGSPGPSNDLAKPAVCLVDINSCDTNEDICSKTCDRISFCKHKIPLEETLNETTWIKPPELTVISNSAFSSESSDLSADSFAAQLSDSSVMSISSISSVHRADNDSSEQHSSFRCVDVPSRNESIYASSPIFHGIFPPKKLRRTCGSPKPEPKKMPEVKRKPSMRDAIKNFFVKKGSGKSKTCGQSRANNC